MPPLPLRLAVQQDPVATQPKFVPFPRLPLEVRRMIWEASIEPRLVEVNMVHNWRRRAPHARIAWKTTRNPVQLAVCTEARKTVLPKYEVLRLACPVPIDGGVPPRTAIVYFHSDLDVLSQDFENITRKVGIDRIRWPGVKARLTSKIRFHSVIDKTFNQCQLFLRHVHLNIHIFRNNRRQPALRSLEPTQTFIDKLLQFSTPSVLQTLTIKITCDFTAPPNPPQQTNLRPKVYRIMRFPSLSPTPEWPYMSYEYNEALALVHKYQGKPLTPQLMMGTLLADGVLITRKCNTTWAAFRVIDPRSQTSQHDDQNVYWPAAQREVLWNDMLEDGFQMDQSKDVRTWLRDLLRNPRSPGYTITPWGLCGVNFGMDRAKVYTKSTDPVDWNWR